MIYGIRLKNKYYKSSSAAGIEAQKLELDEYFHQRGKKRKYGVAYLKCKDLLSKNIWTGNTHIYGITECVINIGDIENIMTRSNDWETDELWKVAVKGSKGKFSYKKEAKVTEQIRRIL